MCTSEEQGQAPLEVRAFIDGGLLCRMALETRVLEPLENPFGPKM
jgi:hypothetical protein